MEKLPKIVVEVETKGLDEVIEKVKQLNELLEKSIKLKEQMPQYEFNKLRIEKNDTCGVKISLDDLEVQNVLEYELKSSNPRLAELSIKLMVEIDGVGN